MLSDLGIYHRLRNGESVQWICQGNSMAPLYFNGDPITIHPFTDERPHPVVGDVVYFVDDRMNFNRHRVGDVFVARDGLEWYRLETGAGWHDQFIERGSIFGYVIPRRMELEGVEPKDCPFP